MVGGSAGQAEEACRALLLGKRLWTVLFTKATYELGLGDADLAPSSTVAVQGFFGYELVLASGKTEMQRVPVERTTLPQMCGATIEGLDWDHTGSLTIRFDNGASCVASAGKGCGEGYVVSSADDAEIYAF